MENATTRKRHGPVPKPRDKVKVPMTTAVVPSVRAALEAAAASNGVSLSTHICNVLKESLLPRYEHQPDRLG